MGTSLTGVNISSSYLGLLKSTDSLAISTTAKTITDGAGNDLPIKLSTNQMLFGTGSASVPALSFNGNTSEGFYIPTDDNIGVTIAGSEVARFLSTGLSLTSSKLTLSNDQKVRWTSDDVYIQGTTSADNIQLGVGGSTQFTFAQTTGMRLHQYGSGNITGTVTQRLGVTSAGQVVEIPIGGGAVDGSGTAGKIVKWSDSDTITDSVISESSGNIQIQGLLGVGLVPESAVQLSVNGQIGTSNNGNAGAPDFTFYGDDNTGMYRVGTDSLGFTTGGTNALTFDSSQNSTFAGNVTINKASNPTSLQIGSSLADDPFIVFQTDGNTMSMGIDRSDSNKFVISDNATLGTNNRLTIDTSGNSTFANSIFLPDNRDIGWNGGYSASKPTLAAVGTTMKMFPSGATSGAQFTLTPTTATFAGTVKLADSKSLIIGTGDDFTINHDGASTGLVNNTGHLYISNYAADKDTVFQNDNGSGGVAEYFRLDGGTETVEFAKNATFAGLVGIGGSPSEDLHITGDTPVIRLTDSDTSRDAQIVAVDGNLRFDADNSDAQSSTNISFRTDGGEAMRIDASRRLGIGTTSPSQKLDVAGNIVIHNSSNAPFIDFVESGATSDSKARITMDQVDTNNGTLLFSTEGSGTLTERLRITSAGNVGIGTTSPNAKLHVVGDMGTSASAVARFRDTNATAKVTRLQLEDRNGAICDGLIDLVVPNSDATGSYLGIGHNDSTQLVLANGGNVGIGTSSPATLLHLYSSAPVLRLQDGGNWGSNATGGIEFYDQNSLMAVSEVVSNGDYNHNLIEAGNMKFLTTNSERMRISSAGKVAIGSTNPMGLLNVSNGGANGLEIDPTQSSGTATLLQSYNRSGSAYTIFRTNAGSYEFQIADSTKMSITSTGLTTIKRTGITGVTKNDMTLQIGFEGNNGQNNLIGFGYNGGNAIPAYIGYTTTSGSSNTKGDLVFGTRDVVTDSDPTERIRITSGGNVGIGTTSPSSNLHVTGAPANGTYLSYLYNSGTHNSSHGLNVQTAATNIAAYGLRVNTGGDSNALAVMGNGSVGIGTSSPDARFSVVTGTANSTASRIGGLEYSGTQRGLTIKTFQSNGGDDCGVEFNAAEGLSGYGSFIFKADTSERMRITSAGNVGIGETSPGAPLHVVNEATSDNGKFQRWAYTSGSSAYVLDLKQTVTSGVVRYNFSMINNGTAYNDVLVLDRGNVGIGTSSPASLLHIQGSTYNRVQTYFDGDYISGFKFSDLNGGIWYDAGNDDLILNSGHANSQMILNTGGSESVRISSAGGILMNTTTTGDGVLRIDFNDASSSPLNYGATITAGRTNSSVSIGFANPNGLVGSIQTLNSATSYNTSSDYRLKEDLKDFNALDIASKIKMYDFKWKADDSRSYGVMAHELQEVVPQAVSGDKDSKEMQQVDYSKLVPILLKSIQELEARVKELEKEI